MESLENIESIVVFAFHQAAGRGLAAAVDIDHGLFAGQLNAGCGEFFFDHPHFIGQDA